MKASKTQQAASAQSRSDGESGSRRPALPYLQAYPRELLAGVERMLAERRLGESLRQRYPEPHPVRTDRALLEFVDGLRCRFMRKAPPLSKVIYDTRLHTIHNALGTHTTVSRVQGNRLKAKREIRIASLFKTAPAAFLNMIVAHELAHLKEQQHDKAFYALCCHIEPAYHQLEFDLRLWLTALEIEGEGPPPTDPERPAAPAQDLPEGLR